MSGLRENWSKLYCTTLTDEDIKGFSDTVSCFFSLLKTWNSKEVIENENKGKGSQVFPSNSMPKTLNRSLKINNDKNVMKT